MQNNMFIFPGVGLGVVAAQATTVTDHMFYVAARRLADCVRDEDLARGKVSRYMCHVQRMSLFCVQVFPRIDDIRDVSHKIAVAVATAAHEDGLARRYPQDRDWYTSPSLFLSLTFSLFYTFSLLHSPSFSLSFICSLLCLLSSLSLCFTDMCHQVSLHQGHDVGCAVCSADPQQEPQPIDDLIVESYLRTIVTHLRLVHFFHRRFRLLACMQ